MEYRPTKRVELFYQEAACIKRVAALGDFIDGLSGRNFDWFEEASWTHFRKAKDSIQNPFFVL